MVYHVRFQEHIREFKYGNGVSKFAHHLNQNGLAVGPID
jgi:hypothetical protein